MPSTSRTLVAYNANGDFGARSSWYNANGTQAAAAPTASDIALVLGTFSMTGTGSVSQLGVSADAPSSFSRATLSAAAALFAGPVTVTYSTLRFTEPQGGTLGAAFTLGYGTLPNPQLTLSHSTLTVQAASVGETAAILSLGALRLDAGSTCTVTGTLVNNAALYLSGGSTMSVTATGPALLNGRAVILTDTGTVLNVASGIAFASSGFGQFTIDKGATVTLGTNLALNGGQLTVSGGGTLNIGATVGPAISLGSGQFTFSGQATTLKSAQHGIALGHGTLTVTNGATLALDAPLIGEALSSGGADGVIVTSAGASLSTAGVDCLRCFVQTGTMTVGTGGVHANIFGVSQGGLLTVAGSVTMDGTSGSQHLMIDGGTLAIGNADGGLALTSMGDFSLDHGGALLLQGGARIEGDVGHTMSGGSRLVATGPGADVVLTERVLYVEDAGTRIDVAGTLTLGGTIGIGSGAALSAGALTVAGSLGADQIIIQDQGTCSVSGSVFIRSELVVGGTMTVAAPAGASGPLMTIDAGTAGGTASLEVGYGTLTLAGDMKVGGAGTGSLSIEGGKIETSGTVAVEAGTLSIGKDMVGGLASRLAVRALDLGTSAAETSGASAVVQGLGSVLTAANGIAVGLASAGNLTVSDGGRLSVASIEGGLAPCLTVGVGAGATGSSLTVSGRSFSGKAAQLNAAGIVVVGYQTAASARVSGGGTITARAVIEGAGAGGKGIMTVTDTGSLLRAGTLAVGTASGQGTLRLAAGGTARISGNTMVRGGVALARGNLSGTGTLTIGAGGALSGFGTVKEGAIVDLGRISVTRGRMVCQGAITGPGTLSVGGGGQLLLGTEASSIRNMFAAGGGTFTAAGAGNLAGTFLNWSTGDAIHLTGALFTSETFADGKLVLTGPSASGTLSFAGSHSAADFVLTADGKGGTVISHG